MRLSNRTLKRQRDVRLPNSPDADIVRIRTERKGVGKLKAMLILLLALAQLGILAWLHLRLLEAFKGYLVLCIALDIVTCLYVLASAKNGRSKAVWIMLILVLFPFGYMIYFLSDENVFFRLPRKRYAGILKSSADAAVRGSAITDGMSADALQACQYLKNACGAAPYKNTSAKYFPSGAQGFDDMLKRCAFAEKFIFLEYFILADGRLLSRLLRVLEERAEAGVDVRIIYDDMGSSGRLSRKTKKRVRAAGIKMYAFNRLVPLYKISMNYRDHRKITVIDGVTAYTGGINVADEYVNEKRMYGYWKDNAVRVDGDAAEGFTLMFLRQWEFVTGKPVNYAQFLGGEAAAKKNSESRGKGLSLSDAEKKSADSDAENRVIFDETAGGERILVEAFPEKKEAEVCKNNRENCMDCGGRSAVFAPYAAGLEYGEPVARNMYAGVIARAAQKIYIMTPYFVPDETITNLLAQKALSGVDVRIVLPGVPDKGFVYLISLDNADKLTKSGVKVYTMSDAFVHTKSVLTENCAVIGSVNFDLRSFFQQYENALYTDDPAVMNGLSLDFRETFPECVQRKYVKRKNGFLRTAAISFLQLFAPMM